MTYRDRMMIINLLS